MPNIPHPRHIQWGRITTHTDQYQITAADACTLAMSTKGEDLNAPEYVIWCYAQRLMTPIWRNAGASLKTLVMQHSQPINPIWAYPNNQAEARRLGGNMRMWRAQANRIYQRERGLPDNQKRYTSNARLRRRRNNINKLLRLIGGDEELWEREIPGNIKLAVRMILTGQVGNMCPGYTDFAAERETRRFRNRVELGGGVLTNGRRVRGNYFVVQPPLRGRTVQIISPSGESSLTKTRRNFPQSRGSRLQEGEQEPTVASAEAENIPVEDRNSGRRTTESQESSAGTDVVVSTSGVPDATSTIQRYTSLRGSVLMQQIRDNWATEIEELLYTFDP